MCDTLVFVGPAGVAFAKNSDREPSEPQVLNRLAAGPARRVDRTTWIEVPAAGPRRAVILSRPTWLFGGEMGVNERGLAIGNEAVFSRLVDRRGQALLGMDLLRLALERCDDARHAVDEITRLLTSHGQGGPAGFRDRSFRYDSSFLIADGREAWVLETAGRVWVARRIVAGVAAISNRYGIGREWDLAAPDLHDTARRAGLWNGRGDLDFAAAFDSFWMPRLGRARERAAAAAACFAHAGPALPTFAELWSWATQHAASDGHPGSNADICMHATGLLRPSQTTATLLAHLRPDQPPVVAATGSSAPCLSVLRPVGWEGDWSVLDPRDAVADGVEPWLDSVWARHEWVHRRCLADPRFAAAWRDARAHFGPAAAAGGGRQDDAAAAELCDRWSATARAGFPLPALLTPGGRLWRRLAQADGFTPDAAARSGYA
jgi:dipeptidase